MTDPMVKGRFLWYELMTTDMKAAGRFYADVVGWSMAPFEGSPEPYELFMRNSEIPVGGVMPIPKGMSFPPHWGLYIGVDKVEDAVAQIERLGGSALSELIEVPGVGRMRVMRDPQQAAFSVYQPETPPDQPEAEPEMGEVAWRELYTTDAAAALKFYSEMFGWRERNVMDMGAMGKYHIFGRSLDLGGMMNKPPEMAQVPPHWGLYFKVPDVKAAAERVKAGGGKVLMGPMEVPGGGWIVNCVDPQGAHFALHHKS
jgi:predicted enzyme related to lactoylglutathione lyase